MNANPAVSIVGGSLVGPFAELALRRNGYTNVTTYEANPHPHSQSGGVMGVRYSTLDLLAEAGIYRGSVMALTDSDVHAYDITPGGEPTKRGTSAFPGVVTSWDALHHELTQRVDVQHGHTITNVHHHNNREILTCTCGTDHESDIVLWADGRKSKGRTLVDPDRPLTYNGYVVWRGLAAPPAETPHGFHRYYDIPNGRLFSVTEPVIQSGKSYWEFSHNMPAEQWTQLAHGAPERHAYMLPHQVSDTTRAVIRDHTQGLPQRFQTMVDQSEVSGIPVNDVPMPGHTLTQHPHGGLSALLGDAIVPVRLQVGAGLNQGLHQAADFAAALTTNSAVSLAGWDQQTMDNLGKVVEQGRSRAHRNNLGWYMPVRPGKTTAPGVDQWAEPEWVTA